MKNELLYTIIREPKSKGKNKTTEDGRSKIEDCEERGIVLLIFTSMVLNGLNEPVHLLQVGIWSEIYGREEVAGILD